MEDVVSHLLSYIKRLELENKMLKEENDILKGRLATRNKIMDRHRELGTAYWEELIRSFK